MWVRGLKHMFHAYGYIRLCVAPHVGAWIETKEVITDLLLRSVAPHVGAWIETQKYNISPKIYSRTPCGCVD